MRRQDTEDKNIEIQARGIPTSLITACTVTTGDDWTAGAWSCTSAGFPPPRRPVPSCCSSSIHDHFTRLHRVLNPPPHSLPTSIQVKYRTSRTAHTSPTTWPPRLHLVLALGRLSITPAHPQPPAASAIPPVDTITYLNTVPPAVLPFQQARLGATAHTRPALPAGHNRPIQASPHICISLVLSTRLRVPRRPRLPFPRNESPPPPPQIQNALGPAVPQLLSPLSLLPSHPPP